MWIQRFRSSPPASSSSTRVAGSSLSRAAMAQPAEPAPITMKSASIAYSCVAIRRPPYWRLCYATPHHAMHSDDISMLRAIGDSTAETQPQKRGDRRLLGTHLRDILFEVSRRPRRQRLEQRAVDVAVEDRGMDVAAPTDRRCVAEMPRDFFDGAHDRLLALALAVEIAESTQRFRRQLRAGPGAEIFRGDVLAGDLAQICVDLLRTDRVLIALFVEILEQLVAGQVAAPFDDAREAAIVDIALVAISALAAEAEMNVAAFDADMTIAQCRQPETLVLLGIFTVADTEQRQFHQAHNSSQYPLARQPRSFQIFLDARPDQRQHARENQ